MKTANTFMLLKQFLCDALPKQKEKGCEHWDSEWVVSLLVPRIVSQCVLNRLNNTEGNNKRCEM